MYSTEAKASWTAVSKKMNKYMPLTVTTQ